VRYFYLTFVIDCTFSHCPFDRSIFTDTGSYVGARQQDSSEVNVIHQTQSLPLLSFLTEQQIISQSHQRHHHLIPSSHLSTVSAQVLMSIPASIIDEY
jgi:hypothetical protein